MYIFQAPNVRALHHRREINKKTRSGDRKLKKTLNAAKMVYPTTSFILLSLTSVQKHHKEMDVSSANFPALQLLHDPQTFAEKLYDILNSYDKRFSLDHKILMMQLLSRVMGAHKLCVLGFYTYIIKYLAYHQLRIPAILVALAQSVHNLTPPDVVTPIVRKLAQEFVHPGVGSEVIAAGINAVREVCRRQPWSMEEDLLGDLVEYRKSRDRVVTAAARSLLQLYREVNPSMLKRRERVSDLLLVIYRGFDIAPG
jgi:protein SDA1